MIICASVHQLGQIIATWFHFDFVLFITMILQISSSNYLNIFNILINTQIKPTWLYNYFAQQNLYWLYVPSFTYRCLHFFFRYCFPICSLPEMNKKHKTPSMKITWGWGTGTLFLPRSRTGVSLARHRNHKPNHLICIVMVSAPRFKTSRRKLNHSNP